MNLSEYLLYDEDAFERAFRQLAASCYPLAWISREEDEFESKLAEIDAATGGQRLVDYGARRRFERRRQRIDNVLTVLIRLKGRIYEAGIAPCRNQECNEYVLDARRDLFKATVSGLCLGCHRFYVDGDTRFPPPTDSLGAERRRPVLNPDQKGTTPHEQPLRSNARGAPHRSRHRP